MRTVLGPQRLLPFGVAAAAAVVALCIIRPLTPAPTRPETVTATNTPSVPDAPSVVVALLDPTDRTYMAVPLASRSKRVHIWWLYRRVGAEAPNDDEAVDPEPMIQGEER